MLCAHLLSSEQSLTSPFMAIYLSKKSVSIAQKIQICLGKEVMFSLLHLEI